LLSTRRTLVILVTFTLAAHHNARNAIIAFRVEDLGFQLVFWILDLYIWRQLVGQSVPDWIDTFATCYLEAGFQG